MTGSCTRWILLTSWSGVLEDVLCGMGRVLVNGGEFARLERTNEEVEE